MIKVLLQVGLRISSDKDRIEGWGPFLLQYVAYRCLRKLTHAYTQGIRECLKKGVQWFLVPEDIFVYGKPLLHNILEFRSVQRPKDEVLADGSTDSDSNLEAKYFMIDNELSATDMAQDVLLNQWRTLGEFIQIFQYEAQLKQELLVLCPVIAAKAADFLSKSTMKYNNSLFRTLKLAYIPLMVQKLRSEDPSDLDNIETVVLEY